MSASRVRGSSGPVAAARLRAKAIGPFLALVFAVASPAARAGDAPCASGAAQAEQLLERGRPSEARRPLLECARPSCPRDVVDACEQLAARVEDASASIVLAALDDVGADVTPVRIEIDGAPVPYEAGQALEIDPGDHSVRVEAPGLESTKTRLTVRAGEKRRTVTVRLRRLAPIARRANAPPEPARSGPPLGSMLLFGGAAATLGASALLGIYAQMEHDSLEERCATPVPACTRDDTAKGRTHAITSTITLGAGLALAAAGLLWWWLDGQTTGGPAAALDRPLRF